MMPRPAPAAFMARQFRFRQRTTVSSRAPFNGIGEYLVRSLISHENLLRIAWKAVGTAQPDHSHL